MEINYAEKLKEENLSLTAIRMAVLEVLCENPHSDAGHILRLVKDKITTTSIQAIYNNLNTLVAYGLVREIKPKGHISLYETRTGDNHHHIVCRGCSCVEDTDCKGSAPCLSPMNDHDFKIDEAEVIFWGLCPSCQKSHKRGEKE